MFKDIYFEYKDKKSICTIKYKGLEFIGEAFCHPEDKDFESQRVGLCIAEARATIKAMRFQRDFELMPQLKILTHLYHNIFSGKDFNPHLRENKMIRSQIKAIENELNIINNEIAEEKKYLKEYINSKDAFYKRLRAKG